MNLRPPLSDRAFRPVTLGFDLMTTGPGPTIIGLGARLTRSITLLGGIGQFIRVPRPARAGRPTPARLHPAPPLKPGPPGRGWGGQVEARGGQVKAPQRRSVEPQCASGDKLPT